jgi:hypothetical protein
MVPDEGAQRCDVALERLTDAIAATLGRLDRARMTVGVEAFAAARRWDRSPRPPFVRVRLHRGRSRRVTVLN